MALEKISGDAYYIAGRTNIGVIKSLGECLIIDSGIDKDAGRKILEELKENGLSVKAIINTHSHADHCGGNNFIQKKTGCKIIAPKIESAFITNPILEPMSLFSGAEPISELKNKFVLAEESKVDEEILPGKHKILEKEIEVVLLKGHSINQIGIGCEGALFCADSLFSKEVLEKHKIPFFTNITEEKETLNFLSNSKYQFYVPSHASPTSNIKELAKQNMDSIENCENAVKETLTESQTTEKLINGVLLRKKITITSPQQYFLLKTSILAYLTHLQEKNIVRPKIKDNLLIWELI